MNQFYVFTTLVEAQACSDFINNSGWFPLQAQNGSGETINWVGEAMEMASGEFCVPRIPESILDAVGVPQASRDAFLTAFGQDIRTLTHVDFPVVEI